MDYKGTLFAVPASGWPEVSFGKLELLFNHAENPLWCGTQYDVTGDGERLQVVKVREKPRASIWGYRTGTRS